MAKTSLYREQKLPLIIEPESVHESGNDAESLISFCADNKTFLRERLLAHGALLFRGFSVKTAFAFEAFVRRVSGDNLLPYVHGTSPRTKVGDNLYTSTEYPPKYFISLHNELSYTHRWPSHVFFCCVIAPKEGGETPLADSRAILKNIDPEVVAQFKAKKVRYIQNLHGGVGFGLSWRQVFETDDKAAVESYCREAGVTAEWKSDGGLRLTHVRPAVASHPVTREEVWFNQADQFHPSEMDQETYRAITSVMGEEDLPKNASFGDGSPLDASMLDHIREVTRKEMALFPWQAGDVLIIDNMLVSHGRMPFKGPRKILVALTRGLSL